MEFFLIETLPANRARISIWPISLRLIVEQTAHLGDLVNQLVLFQTVGRETIALELIDMAEWLRGMAEIWRPISHRTA